MSKEIFKKVATEFFYHWWNEEGNNTSEGFDKWWDDKGKELVKNCSIPDVVEQSEQLFCEEHKPRVRYEWQKGNCLTCSKKLKAK
jgi:hypothetical protein